MSGTALGNITARLQEQPLRTSLSRWRGDAPGAAVAVRFGLQGKPIELNAACSGGGR